MNEAVQPTNGTPPKRTDIEPKTWEQILDLLILLKLEEERRKKKEEKPEEKKDIIVYPKFGG